MSQHPRHPASVDESGEPEALPAALADDLKALRTDAPPTRNLWPGIAARLPGHDTRAADSNAFRDWNDRVAGTHAAVVDGASCNRNATAHPKPMHGSPRRDSRTRHGRRRWPPAALAASLVIVSGLAWQLAPLATVRTDGVTSNVAAHPMVHAADAMGREYSVAFAAIDRTSLSPEKAKALANLDDSAREVRAALKRDPDARFLFDRLQRVYALRLDLSQRFAQAG